jgi:hypothetical protein
MKKPDRNNAWLLGWLPVALAVAVIVAAIFIPPIHH